MTPDAVITLASDALKLTLLLTAPMLAIALIVGLVVSIVQAVTQVQEMTLAFVPKIVAVFVVGIISAPWALEKIVAFLRTLLVRITSFGT